MESSSLTTASSSGVLARRTVLLRLQADERLVALIREGHDRAFEVLVNRYQPRLLAFCRHLVGSPQDAEDVLQEVFAAAHAAILADNRTINARPWLYRIARNRCLNHLRRGPARAGRGGRGASQAVGLDPPPRPRLSVLQPLPRGASLKQGALGAGA